VLPGNVTERVIGPAGARCLREGNGTALAACSPGRFLVMRDFRLHLGLFEIGGDVRHAARSLCQSPLSTLLAVLTLGIGIGGSTAFFGLLDAAFLRPLPFPESERLTRILEAVPAGEGASYLANLVPRKVDFIARRSHSFDELTWERFESFALLGAGDPVQVGGASLSPGAAQLLGLRPVLGRVFDAAEETRGEASGAVIISNDLWRDRLGSDLGAIGKTLRLGDRLVTVIGVAQSDFHFPYRADVWQPLRLDVSDLRDLLVIGRLRLGVTVGEARSEMAAVADDLRRETGPAGRHFGIEVVPLREELLRDQERTSTGLFLATVLFLVMASANVAGLLAARGSLRRREVAIRSALGAGGWMQLRLALAEPMLLAAAAGAVALALVRLAAPALTSLVPQVLSNELGVQPVRLGWRVGGFAFVASILAAIVAALGSALPVWRPSPAAAVASERTPGLRGRQRGLRTLLGGEIALLSLLLLASAAIVAGFLAVALAPLGFEPHGVWAFQIVAPVSRYGDPATLARLVDRIAGESQASPGARVAVTTINPLSGATWGESVRRVGMSPDETTEVNLRLVSSGLFETLGIELVSGRDFAARDAAGPPVAIVSRRLARRLWQRQDVVGELLVRGPDASPIVATVVGVAGDVEDAGDLRETLYLPFVQLAGVAGANQFWVVARSTAGGATWVRDLERGIWRIDPELAWSDAGWMDSMRSRSLTRERLGSRLASFYAGFGLLLAGLGLGGIMAFLLSRREVELGVRQALGATPGQLLRALTAEGLGIAALGLAAGFAAFFALQPLLAHWVPDVAHPAPIVWAEVAGVVLAVSSVAAYLPARCAARRDPIAALREG
jgi:putative ABC transport system permease protein